MSECRDCGTPIDWIRMTTGKHKHMPVDPEPVFVVEGDGKDRFITDEGEVIFGRQATEENRGKDLVVAFVPHWRTCPYTADFRRQ